MREQPTLDVLRLMQPSEAMFHGELLRQIAAANWNERLTKEDLIAEVTQGRISAWSIAGVKSGLALVRIEQSPTRLVLILDGLAGHNVLSKARAIGQDLETIARYWGAGSMETSASDPRWKAVAKRLGFAAVSVVYERKIV